MPQDDRTELRYRIALTMAPAIGPITARKLIEKVGSARAVFEQKKEALEKIEGIGPRLSQSFNASRLLDQAEKEIGIPGEAPHFCPLFSKIRNTPNA